MKKITLTIIILMVLLLFSGCDAMLEFFYPEYADDNAVNITISITTTDITDYTYDTNIPLYVELYIAGESPAAHTPVRSIEVIINLITISVLYLYQKVVMIYGFGRMITKMET